MSRFEFDPSPSVIRLPIQVSGPKASGVAWAIFDPGADSVVLDREVAVRLGFELDRSPAEELTTAGSRAHGRRISLAEVRAVGESVTDVSALVMELDPHLRADALRGNTFLCRFKVTFDLRQGYLELQRGGGRKSRR